MKGLWQFLERTPPQSVIMSNASEAKVTPGSDKTGRLRSSKPVVGGSLSLRPNFVA
jgi:hypothetical protein